jgi:RarD protein
MQRSLFDRRTGTLADRRNGVLAVLGAYTSWGLFPLYFKALRAHPLEVLVHRIIWSALFLLAINAWQRRWDWLRGVLRSPRLILGSLLSATLLSINWFVYIWAVGANRVIDASLGYFITPLLQVVFGVVLLREALRPVQWLALGTAALGVVWLTLEFGQLPWVGLALAASFGARRRGSARWKAWRWRRGCCCRSRRATCSGWRAPARAASTTGGSRNVWPWLRRGR